MSDNSHPDGVQIVFTHQERRKLLDDSIAVPLEILSRIEAAPSENDTVRVWLSLDELEDLVSGLAADADHAQSRRREQFFDDLYDRLSAVLDEASGIDREDDGFSVEYMADGLTAPPGGDGADELDWINATISKWIAQRNTTPLPEFGGLSAEQVFFLNHSGWWEEPFPIRLAPNLPFEQVKSSAFLRNALTFLRAVDEEKGAPATAAGNLSRAFVARMLDAMVLPPGHLEAVRHVCKVINERDAWELHLVRVICQVGKLLRKVRNRFTVTRKTRAMLTEERAGELYRHLFDATFRKFNLLYLTRFDDVAGVQATAPYALYRIGRLDPARTYEVDELVETVFLPAVRDEIAAKARFPEASQYVLQSCLFGPLERLGLIQIPRTEGATRYLSEERQVRKLPLFDAFLQFNP